MKKIITIVALACVLALSAALAGCGGSSGAGSSAASAATSSSSSTSAAASESAPASAVASATVKVNMEGFGQIAWAYEGQAIEWDDDYPYQSAVINDAAGQTIAIAAKTDPQQYGDDFKFVKWTRDGADFSTDEEIHVLVDCDAEYVAVFEFGEK